VPDEFDMLWSRSVLIELICDEAIAIVLFAAVKLDSAALICSSVDVGESMTAWAANACC
jgi:hypothetical protein